MKIALTMVCSMLALTSFQNNPGSQGWRGIIPMHSTRTDVERLLGLGTNNDFLTTYYLQDENVLFHYSTGDCKSGKGAWDVPLDTVIWITVHPKPNSQFSALKLDENKFKKTRNGHIAAIVSYINEEDGLSIEVDEESDAVRGYYYGPTRKEKHLRCP